MRHFAFTGSRVSEERVRRSDALVRTKLMSREPRSAENRTAEAAKRWLTMTGSQEEAKCLANWKERGAKRTEHSAVPKLATRKARVVLVDLG